MNLTMIRYKTKPEAAGENQRLIEEVFRELNEKALPGVKYAAVRRDDGVFVHLVETGESDNNSITDLEAFAAFQRSIRERCHRRASPQRGADHRQFRRVLSMSYTWLTTP